MMTEINEQKYLRTLELDKVLLQVSELAGCDEARERILKILPQSDYRAALGSLLKTEAAHSLLLRYGAPSIGNIASPLPSLRRAQVGAVLGMGELLEIGRLLTGIRTLREYRGRCEERDTAVDEEFWALQENRPLEDKIRISILSQDEMADDASAELADIRRRIRAALASVREQLERMVRSSHYQTYLQETIVTQRDGRFVVPVKIEHKNEIKGLIHDTSSSGATVFVEPTGVVEENNKIRLLENEEQKEIARILGILSGECGEAADVLILGFEALLKLDILFAKARYAKVHNAVLPKLRQDGGIDLHAARHPLIDKKKIVPIDIRLGMDFDTIIVTGPNTGGKTVAIKTLGLLALMAMCGMLIPAGDRSEISVFEHILPDIGDEQSIEQSLSTFSSHMGNLVSILKTANENSLVLVDELGAGTDPVEGAALAVAIIERLRIYKAKIAATTHYAEMKMFALETPGVENACCEFDIATLRPTYRLLIGVPGRSNAFAISERLGLDTDIIQSAKGHVASDNARFEDVVQKLEAARQTLEEERRAHTALLESAKRENTAAQSIRETLEADREKEIEKARIEAGRIVSDVKRKSEELLHELDDLRRQKDAERFGELVAGARSGYKSAVRSLENHSNPVSEREEDYVLPRPLEKGDSVKIVAFGQNGVVLSPPDSSGNVYVQAGALKTKVKVSELRLIEKPKGKKAVPNLGRVTRTVQSKATRSASSEFDMRGMSADEGVMELERFIDSCVMMGVKNITIIHGKGTGVLRKAVHDFLKRYSEVRAYRLGVFGEGEAGVTIAELK